jgi:hypothetical protein
MAVYVDNMRALFRGKIMCHMVGDSEDELHAMAFAIGMQRRWYQDLHYDISIAMREKAVVLGAKEITSREAALVRRALRDRLRSGNF